MEQVSTSPVLLLVLFGIAMFNKALGNPCVVEPLLNWAL